MTEDIKRLLGRAFSPEPPLTLDREEVFRRGQRRVRARRLAASGSAAASVIAVVVGAVALGGLVGPDRDTIDGGAPVPSTSGGASPRPSPPSTTSSPPASVVVTTDERAAELTKILTDAKVIPPQVEAIGDGGTAALVFNPRGDTYQLATDLQDADGEGSIVVALSRVIPTEQMLACSNVTPGQKTCDAVEDRGIRLWIRTSRWNTGAVEYEVDAIRPEGTWVHLSVTNAPSRGLGGQPPPRPVPPLDTTVLQRIATLPDLSFF